MATQKESTLNVRNFRGISRYLSSPNEPPNNFHTLQNLWSPSRGELALIPGCEQTLPPDAIPGVGEIRHLEFLSQFQGAKQGWVAYYKPNTATLPAPTGMTYTTQGGAAGSYRVATEFVGPGGARSYTRDAAQVFGTSGLQITLPTNVPSFVYCVHFYTEVTAGGVAPIWVWCGSLTRKPSGFFDASITILTPPNSGANTNTAYESQPTGFQITPQFVGSGELIGGRTYFFGLTPWMYSADQGVCGKDSNGNVFAFTLPEGNDSFIISFAGIPATAGDVAPTAYTHNVLFLGETPEDMLPVHTGLNGISLPIAKTVLTSGVAIVTLPANSDKYSLASHRSAGKFNFEAFADRLSSTQWRLLGDITAASLVESALDTYTGACYINLPWSVATHRELLPNVLMGTLDATKSASITSTDFPPIGDPAAPKYKLPLTLATDWKIPLPGSFPQSVNTMKTRSYENRLICVNGKQTPWYTNGTVIKPMCRDFHTAYTPVTTYIEIYKDRLVLAGGSSNFANTAGLVFFSETGNPRSFTASPPPFTPDPPDSPPAWNFLNVNQGNSSAIVGLGLYSASLSTVGQTVFLIVGKESSSYSWNGGATVADESLEQIDNQFGWLSPDAFVRTSMGPLVFTTGGLFRVTANGFEPVNGDINPILISMSALARTFVQAVCVGERVVLRYLDEDTTSPTVGTFVELWLDFRREEDQKISLVWTGPHTIDPYSRTTVAPSYGIYTNFRVSYDDSVNKVLRRDVAGVTVQSSGANIPIRIKFHETDLGQSDFNKVLTGIYLKARIQQALALTFVSPIYDVNAGAGIASDGASQSAVAETINLLFSGAPTTHFRLFQKIFSQRYVGSVFQPEITFSVNKDFRLVSMSIIFTMSRRRLL